MKVTPLQFLTTVAFVMRLDKAYRARKVYQNSSTADQAVTLLVTGTNGSTLDDEVMAEEAMGVIDTLEGNTEFNANLKKFVLAVDIDLNNKFATGTAAYAIQYLKREMEKEARVASNKDSKSTHQGTEGKRIEFVGTHISFEVKRNQDGTQYSVTRVQDTKGNVFQAYGLTEKNSGDTIAVKGTVKKHLERDGIKFTTLNRALWTDGTGITEAEEKAARKKARMKAKSEKFEQEIAKALGADAKVHEVAIASAKTKPSFMPCANSVHQGCQGTVWTAASTNLCGRCLLTGKPYIADEPGQEQADEP